MPRPMLTHLTSYNSSPSSPQQTVRTSTTPIHSPPASPLYNHSSLFYLPYPCSKVSPASPLLRFCTTWNTSPPPPTYLIPPTLLSLSHPSTVFQSHHCIPRSFTTHHSPSPTPPLPSPPHLTTPAETQAPSVTLLVRQESPANCHNDGVWRWVRVEGENCLSSWVIISGREGI